MRGSCYSPSRNSSSNSHRQNTSRTQELNGMSSVRAIAKKLNVSIATVSRALNNHPEINAETSAKVLKAANEIGYFNSVGRRITTNLGFVSTRDNDFFEYDALLLAG